MPNKESLVPVTDLHGHNYCMAGVNKSASIFCPQSLEKITEYKRIKKMSIKFIFAFVVVVLICGRLQQFRIFNSSTLQPLYNMICYNMVLDITQFKVGSQKCIGYIEKLP